MIPRIYHVESPGPAGARSNAEGIAQYHQRPTTSERAISRVLYVATILLGPPSPVDSSDQPGVIVRATRPLSGLASGGVCLALAVISEAVRSYRTISPLPVSRQA